MTRPIVAIVGRQNVGKSTLVNRIAGKEIAIVEDWPGTTRDRIFTDTDWNGADFTLVDTGGLELQDQSEIAREVRKQAAAAIKEADIIVFLTEVSQGLMPSDQDIADILRRSQKPVILAVNKVDSEKQRSEASEFYRLGFGEIIPVSAHHGRGVAELLDKIVSVLPPRTDHEDATGTGIKLAIVGRPHVGKSLLLNSLLGKERSIVGNTPGTTRDAIDIGVDYNGQNMIIIDTAGIRRRGRIEKGIEWYSVLRSMRAIDRSDISLLVIDAVEPITDQDTHIAGYIEKAGKGIIILVNKWDLVTEKNKTIYNEYIASRLKFASYAPILYISAKLGQGINKIMPMIEQIGRERSMRIPDKEIETIVKEAVVAHNLPHKGNKVLSISSVKQSGINPPTFQFTVNDARLIHFSYERFLENRLRAIYSFRGTPIRLVFKTRG
ncbi:MAG: ribosome biogenesis GTPase Der [Dehalococcoidales bacterium]|nr:ribosome biogenesis GTPase Der [Dehalococcoidales bacterium]